MHPTDLLSQEHRAIESKLNLLEQELRAAVSGAPLNRAFFDETLDFFRNFADGCHHAKEENLLFPLLTERGMPADGGPIAVMLAEHDAGRAYLRAVRDNLDAAVGGSKGAREQVCANAEAYIELLRHHIYKEDNILFRMAKSLLAPDDVAELEKQFAALEVPERFQAAVI
jgi:hemerythrin-like domain-containing protein